MHDQSVSLTQTFISAVWIPIIRKLESKSRVWFSIIDLSCIIVNIILI